MDPSRGLLLAVTLCLAALFLAQAAGSAPPSQGQPAGAHETPQGKSVHSKAAGNTGEHRAARETVSVEAAGAGEACAGAGWGPGDGNCEQVAAESARANARAADSIQLSKNPELDVHNSEKASMAAKKLPENQQHKQPTEQKHVNSGQIPTSQNQDKPKPIDQKHGTQTQDTKPPQQGKEPPQHPTKEQTTTETKNKEKAQEEKNVAGAATDLKHENKPTIEKQPAQNIHSTHENIPAQSGPASTKTPNAVPSTTQASEVNVPQSNAAEKASPAVKESESKPPAVKTTESKPKPADTKHAEPQTAQVKVNDVESIGTKPTDVKPVGTKETQTEKITVRPSDSKAGETKPRESKKIDVKPADAKPSETKPTEPKPIPPKVEQVQTKDIKPSESKSAVKTSDSKVGDTKPTETNKTPDVKTTISKQPETKPTEPKPIPPKEAQAQTKDAKPSEPIPTETKPTVPKDPKNDAVKIKTIDVGKIGTKEHPATEQWPGRTDQPARILAVMPYNARSHFEAFRPLLVALAQRGHHVDVISHFPQQGAAPPGYRDIAVNGSFPSFEDAVDLDLVADLNVFTDALMTWYETLDVCAHVLGTPQVQSLINSNEKYDLVLNEIFGAECLAGFAHKFNTPVVGLVSSVAPPGALDRVGNPESPAYVSNYYLPFVPPLSFWQRFASALYGTALRRLKALVCDRASDALARRYFGEGLPSSAELAARTALVLVNSHPAVNQPRPLVPAVVEVGGMHIAEPRPLPQDLERLVSGPAGEHGVVVVSLGTMVRLASFPPERLAALWAALGALPHLVIVKSKEDLPGRAPPNVHAFPWLPQFDLLSHPRARLLLSHGGLLSLQEAVTAGVPVLGMPLFSDQRLNVRSLEAKGAALLIEHSELTHERLTNALQRLLNDPSFRSSAQTLRAQFVDHPRSPLRSAVWWVEYTLRHNGAPHLRCAAADMPQHQLLLLDVVAAIALAVAAALGALWVVLAAVYRAIRFGTARPKTRLPTVDAEGRPKRYTKHKLH